MPAIPKVLLCFHSRPMCAGLMFREAFRQAGCEVKVYGPSTPHVYGKGDGTDHTFDEKDYVEADYAAANEPIDLNVVIDGVKAFGWEPDCVVMIDQYDPFYVMGDIRDRYIPVAYVCVENWGEEYAMRTSLVSADYYGYMIRHTEANDIPIPSGAEFVPFGFDPQIHKYIEIDRSNKVCQIGTAYQPRPQIWNALRSKFDGAAPLGDTEYLNSLYESENTIFGRVPTYRGMIKAYNSCKTALSSSNCDFSPMRTCESYGMGCVYISDDVPAIRHVLGPPLSEGGFWVAHNRDADSSARAIDEAVEAYDDIVDRGIAHVYKHHTYRNRAERILEKFGIEGASRIV